MANNNSKRNKEFRKESRKQENRTYLLIGLAAVVLGIIIILSQKIDFSSSVNVPEQDVEVVDQTTANEQTSTDNQTQADEQISADNQTSADEQAPTDNQPPVDEQVPTNDSVGETTDAPVVAEVSYRFRNKNLLNQHYEKHGIEMGFDSAESYEAAASAVINNPEALNKVEAEDGDFVYYVEATNEFVILSTDGYIRTYFLPSGGKAYYDRQ